MKLSKQKIVLQSNVGEALLNWPSKHPLTEVEAKEAQVVSTYFAPTENDINTILFGDNLEGLSYLLLNYKGKINLIYIDPPFDSNANYYKKVFLKGQGNKSFCMKQTQYEDKWTQATYLQFLYERLQLLSTLLAPTGSIYVHCDWRKSHHIRLMLDEIFGAEHFRNEIIWKRGTVKGAKARGNQFARNHDTILYYTKSAQYTFNRQYVPFEMDYLKRFKKDDGDGLGPYRDDQAIGTRSKQAIGDMLASGKMFEVNGKLRIKTYLKDLQGVVMDDNWSDIAEVNVMSKKRTMYPTQKPESLLERIIETSSNVGDIVLDCFSGSGTTAYVAANLKRNFIAIDNNIGAIFTTAQRLNTLKQPYTIQTVECNWPILNNILQYKIDEAERTITITDFDTAYIVKEYPQLADIPWQQLIDQVEIDYAYDGQVFKPTLIDCPKAGATIIGTYNLESSSTRAMAIQITDIFMNLFFLVIKK